MRKTNIIYTVGSYYGYPIIHMQYKLAMAQQYFYTYGMCSLQGLFRPILNVIKILGGGSVFQSLYKAGLISNLANSTFVFHRGLHYNAFVTAFYYFYCDGGIWGIVIFSFIFGYFSNKIYLYYRANYHDDRSTMLFLLSFGLPICFSFVRFQYALSTIPWAMVLCCWVTRNKKLFIYTKR